MASHVPSLFLLLSLSTLLLSPSAYSTLFVEHIGSHFSNVKFTDVPINTSITDFHFLLSFANDHDNSTTSPPCTDGNFNASWDPFHFGPGDVIKIKSLYPIVKVAVSLGGGAFHFPGGTLHDESVIFYPCSVHSWIVNAVSSVTKIIEEYNLDGINIHYDNFQYTDPTIFTACIGHLIKTLKKNKVIQFASISPSPSTVSENNYLALWKEYNDQIDYVNYKFYDLTPPPPPVDFLSDYYIVSSKYVASGNDDKVLISFSTDPSDDWSKTAILDAAKILRSENNLNGIVIWNADFSKINGLNFADEVKAQNILLGESFQYHEEA